MHNQLIERDNYLSIIRSKLLQVENGDGHSIFIGGESGIGKTSLLKYFREDLNDRFPVFEGLCDALFTPRPLAPLYDIAWKIDPDIIGEYASSSDRTAIFARFFQAIAARSKPCVIIFEDIHWADEATLDFIKFFSRRIARIPCLFILTYRDNEMNVAHSMSAIFGQLSAETFSRMLLLPLSKKAVIALSQEKGFDGEKVFHVSGGNPFYVREILSSYSDGIPASIRDAIISAYHKTSERTRHVWDLLSIVPGKLEIKLLEKFDGSYTTAIENCLQLQILILDNDQIFFKHELFRRTIEQSLSPLKRLALNRRVLELFLKDFENAQQVERIVHHAKNANDYSLVVKYAPLAAKKASALGSHVEAARLLLTAVEYYHGEDTCFLCSLYEEFAYESYLVNDIKQAIIFTTKVLKIARGTDDHLKTADSTRFLSYLKCIDGKGAESIKLGHEAIEALKDLPASGIKAMAYSNMSQLKMHRDETAETLKFGEKAIAIAEEIGDEEALCHALNNVGAVRMNLRGRNAEGLHNLQRSLEISLKNGFDEHAARAFTNIGANAIKTKDYKLARQILEQGLDYCEERQLEFWMFNMLALKSKLLIDKGSWKESLAIAEKVANATHGGAHKVYALMVMASIAMRCGKVDAVPFLKEAKKLAFQLDECQVVIPVCAAMLEYEWITGSPLLDDGDMKTLRKSFDRSIYVSENNELVFWLQRSRDEVWHTKEAVDGFDTTPPAKLHRSITYWQQIGNPYMQAVVMFEGNEEEKKKAASMIHDLDADIVYEKMKQQLRSFGIKGIPRGLRRTTKLNAAQLTQREMDVLQLLKEGLQNKEIAGRLYISAKTVDHHISSILFKLDVNSRVKAVTEAVRLSILK